MTTSLIFSFSPTRYGYLVENSRYSYFFSFINMFTKIKFLSLNYVIIFDLQSGPGR